MANQRKKPIDQVIMEKRREAIRERERETKLKELKNIPLDIRTGSAIVNEEEVIFHRMNMIENNISMIVPKNVKELTKEIVDAAYVGDYQPQYVYASHDASIDITYDVLFSETDEESFLVIRDELMKGFRQEYEDFTMRYEVIQNEQQQDLFYFIRKNKTEAGMIYGITYQFLVKNFLIMGRISCTGYRLRDWKEILFQMMCSVQCEEA